MEHLGTRTGGERGSCYVELAHFVNRFLPVMADFDHTSLELEDGDGESGMRDRTRGREVDWLVIDSLNLEDIGGGLSS